MRLLVYADLQATDGNDVCFLNPAKTLQHYRTEKFFVDMQRIYAEHNCCGVIDLGDTTDDRTSITWPTIEVLGAGLKLLPDSDWKITTPGVPCSLSVFGKSEVGSRSTANPRNRASPSGSANSRPLFRGARTATARKFLLPITAPIPVRPTASLQSAIRQA